MNRRDRSSLAWRAHRRRLKVAIDGPAGAGKTTIGTALAELLAVPVLDTGLMYRAVTQAVLEQGLSPSDGTAAASVAGALRFTLTGAGVGSRVVANGEPLDSNRLHGPNIDGCVSIIATHQPLRSLLVNRQRELAARTAIVMLGRDIATVVLPTADVKLFVMASPEVRAARRSDEPVNDVGSQGITRAVLDELRARDQRDSTRQNSPLQMARDAVLIDTSTQTVAQSVAEATKAVMAALDRSSTDG